jgi:hypothetical protein
MNLYNRIFQMKNIGLLGIFVLVISGCATVYTKDNFTMQEFHRDNAECLAQCGQASGARGCVLATQHFYHSCMLGKGWREDKK